MSEQLKHFPSSFSWKTLRVFWVLITIATVIMLVIIRSHTPTIKVKYKQIATELQYITGMITLLFYFTNMKAVSSYCIVALGAILHTP